MANEHIKGDLTNKQGDTNYNKFFHTTENQKSKLDDIKIWQRNGKMDILRH